MIELISLIITFYLEDTVDVQLDLGRLRHVLLHVVESRLIMLPYLVIDSGTIDSISDLLLLAILNS